MNEMKMSRRRKKKKVTKNKRRPKLDFSLLFAL